MGAKCIVIGILALQGAFAEHEVILSRLAMPVSASSTPNGKIRSRSIVPKLVKTAADLAVCDALIIPGGESTTIALLARLNGLLEPLRDFAGRDGKPIWGTCAGAILLASGGVVGAKKGGQDVFGGVDIRVERNGWGSQLESFEAELDVPRLKDPSHPFKGVFIRAPVILALTPSAHEPAIPIEILARVRHHSIAEGTNLEDADTRSIVAVRQGHHLVTTFHPELTKDTRFHQYFVLECVLPSIALRSGDAASI